MAKSSKAYVTLLVLALILPIAGANFLFNIFATFFSNMVSLDVYQYVQIFMPFTCYLVGLAFSIVALVMKKESPVLPLFALVLNSILVVSGVFYIVMTYFVTTTQPVL